MRKRQPVRPRVQPCAVISRGGHRVDRRSFEPGLVIPRTPEERQAMKDRGIVLAAAFDACGSYAAVGRAFNVATETVRYWVHEGRKLTRTTPVAAATRLRKRTVQLAVDRVEEGLLEGDLEFAADLGTKVLKGLGELQTHAAVKGAGANAVASLTLNIVRTDPNTPAPAQLAGAVVGQPYDEKAAAADVIDAEPEDDGESPHAAR